MTAITDSELIERVWTAISAADLGEAWSDILIDPSDSLEEDEKRHYLLGVVGFMFGVMVYTTRTLVGVSNGLKHNEAPEMTYQEMVATIRRSMSDET